MSEKHKVKYRQTEESILDVQGAASLLGVSRHTIYRLLSADKIPAVRVGREWRFHRTTLIQWVASGCSVNQLGDLLKNARVVKNK